MRWCVLATKNLHKTMKAHVKKYYGTKCHYIWKQSTVAATEIRIRTQINSRIGGNNRLTLQFHWSSSKREDVYDECCLALHMVDISPLNRPVSGSLKFWRRFLKLFSLNYKLFWHSYWDSNFHSNKHFSCKMCRRKKWKRVYIQLWNCFYLLC